MFSDGGDYKYGIQMVAEELAEEKYGMGFYDLTHKQQFEVYSEAQRQYFDRQADFADYHRKAEREHI